MTRLGSKFVSEDTDTRGQTGPAGNDSTVPGPAGEDSTVPGPAGDDGIVASVVAGTNITVDNTDPANPIVASTAAAGDPLTTKGDVFGFDTDAARIPVGANDEVLTADSTAALGVAWKTPAGAAVGERLETSNSSFAYSGSTNATKGISFNCINNLTVQSVEVWTGTDSAATYKVVIADVSGATDVIGSITGTTNTTTATTAINPKHKMVFASPVNLVSGTRYAFLMVRTDGSGTSICRSSFTIIVISDDNLTYGSSCIEPTNEPATSQAIRLDTTNTVHMIINYTVD